MARTVPVRLMNLSGTGDGLAELEVGFVDQLLPLFQVTNGTPRADLEVVRINSVERFLDYLFFGDVDLIHLSSHGTSSSIRIGDGKLPVSKFRKAAKDEDLNGTVILNTSCQMASAARSQAFIDAGASAYIAAKTSIWAKDAAIFSSAFYCTYFGTIHVNKSKLYNELSTATDLLPPRIVASSRPPRLDGSTFTVLRSPSGTKISPGSH